MHTTKTQSIRQANVQTAKHASSSLAFFLLNATVFISSGCIMMIELVAGRIISRHLGSSVYTWTSVIGIVLAGIAIGNYLGGLIADRRSSRETLAKLFIAASGMAGAITILDNMAAGWSILWMLPWPARVALHVFIAFFFPCAVLGMISPIVGKMALDLGRQTGRTIGDIYAWGVVGSIVGTFLAGFYLIEAIGSKPLVWTVAAILGVMAILYWQQSWKPWAWLGAVFVFFVLATASPIWAKSLGETLLLREPPTPFMIYSDDSNYSHIEIIQITREPDVRGMLLDTLLHSQLDVAFPSNFRYEYERVYAAITLRLRRNAEHVNSLTIGGGGYVYPRYMDARWPGSRTDVAEIDPAVTEAAHAAFGLPRDTAIRCYHEDGRVLMNHLLAQKNAGHPVDLYDFIYCDAVHDYNVPYQLTTREFMQSAFELTKPDGAFLMNMIDMYQSGKFLGALVNTMKGIFPYVYVFVEGAPVSKMPTNRNTFIIAGLKQPFDIDNLGAEYHPQCEIFPFTQDEMATLFSKTAGMVLSDEYSPVETLLAEVVRDAAKSKASGEWFARIRKAIDEKQYGDAITIGLKAITLMPGDSTLVCEYARALQLAGRVQDAIMQYQSVLAKKPNELEAHIGMIECYTALKEDDKIVQHYEAVIRQHPYDVNFRFSYGALLLDQNQNEAALAQFQEIMKFKKCHVTAMNDAGAALFKLGRLKEALAQFVEVIGCEHENADAWGNLAFILSQGGVGVDSVAFEKASDYARLGDALYQRRQADLCRQAYEMALKIEPKNIEALFGRANALAASGDPAAAKAAYQAVLDVQPTHDLARSRLADMEQKLKSLPTSQP